MKTSLVWAVVGNLENRRVKGFAEAIVGRGHRPPLLYSYEALLKGECHLEGLPEQVVIRLDSPGENFAVERLLLDWGAKAEPAESYFSLTADEASRLEEDPGQIVAPRQWYR